MSAITSDNHDEPIRYAIRFYERASRDIDATVVYLADKVSQPYARSWYIGITKAIQSLSQLPERYALAPESVFVVPTRNLTWARPNTSVSHRILYHVVHGGQDGFVVWIMYVRGATMAPITLNEACEIEAQQ